MEKIVLKGRCVVPGIAEGEALVTTEYISGWGGIDPVKGTVIDVRSDLYEECFTGRVLVSKGAKGSSGWAGLFQQTRLQNTAPAAMIFTSVNSKAALGSVVTRVPVVAELSEDPTEVIRTGDWVRVDGDQGIVEITRK
ncbi:MAG: DUF126 domain-containing protein [Lachnospiraceae bacterium]|nr:DUF126 domain-containing protein [Lachnospiraceae bacterium]MCI9133118.1 DUF126 domain-containing protein [Lachnospiraceae bacterium]